ncbi:multidrug ABC transporter permease [Henriciella mobilis]|uniref:ABC transporter permease n=1 Tax=Henriciella mobilis TaxID=2305467 RepID=UPI000E670A26|nr:ABC transporter permease [Henriciella mobilis]RIJ15922.1 multidrug ABC transporter permease [Henriciella mobilis]RIJ21132.1 multidrug ABC transporter permease [Henriciella mobilis]
MTDEISAAARPLPKPPRSYGAINWIGLWTLYKREVGRFLKVWMQTLFAPVITTLLFMTVFKLAFGNRGELTGDFAGLDYNSFLAPGLVIMSMLQNAFQNTSSSLTIAKVQGSQVDFLMPPLSPLELTLGFIFGAVTRGLMVGIIGALAIHFSGLASLDIANIWPVIWFSLMATIFLAALGAVGGIWAEKFDHLAAVTNFVIVPLTFLSGTFYDIKVLVEPFQSAAHFDPIFYLIDGFRAGFIGVSNSDLMVGVIASGVFTFLAGVWVWWLFRIGYKLKA